MIEAIPAAVRPSDHGRYPRDSGRQKLAISNAKLVQYLIIAENHAGEGSRPP